MPKKKTKSKPTLDRKAWNHIWDKYHKWYVENCEAYGHSNYDVCGIDAFDAMKRIVRAELRKGGG